MDNKIRERLIYLSQSYRELASPGRATVDYADPATRFAYVYSYVAAHGDYIVQILDANDNLGLFDNKQVRVSCIGGGPGSDLIGILKYISDRNLGVEKIIAYLLDGEQSWSDTWTELGEQFKLPVPTNVNFQRMDVSDPSSWRGQKNFLKANLFTLSYFVSEIYSLGEDAVSFWTKVFDSALPGAIFLYVDNGSQEFNDYFDGLWNSRPDIELISGMKNKRYTPSYTEQASHLQEYKQKFDRNAKIQSVLTWRILRKK